MAYVQCERCQKVVRELNLHNGVCEDCRLIEFGDYVLEVMAQDKHYRTLHNKLKQEARRLRLIDTNVP